MSLNNIVKRLQNVMWNDAGINGDAQRIEQMTWLLFLKVYDAKEEIWELNEDNYTSIIPDKFRWRNWAKDNKDGNTLTGDDLLYFINTELFPELKKIEIDENTPINKLIVKSTFEDTYNYMKDGILLRQVVNIIDEIDFTQNDLIKQAIQETDFITPYFNQDGSIVESKESKKKNFIFNLKTLFASSIPVESDTIENLLLQNENNIAEKERVNYEPTDEFRAIQEKSRGASREEVELFHNGSKQIDEGIRDRLSRIFERQILSSSGSDRDVDALLMD